MFQCRVIADIVTTDGTGKSATATRTAVLPFVPQIGSFLIFEDEPGNIKCAPDDQSIHEVTGVTYRVGANAFDVETAQHEVHPETNFAEYASYWFGPGWQFEADE